LIKNYFITLIQQYGNSGIIVSLALEFLGLPIPGEPLMAFLGYLTWKNSNESLILSIIYAVIGTFLGSILAYAIGFRYGENFLIKYGRYIFITQDKLEYTERMVNKNKVLLLLFSRYIPGARHIVPYLSGISKIKLSSFLFYNLIGSIIWCISFIGLGFVLGENWNRIETIAKGYFYIIVLLIGFIFIVIKYFGKYKKMIFTVTFPVLLFIKLSEDLIRNELVIFDKTIYDYISTFISKSTTTIMVVITYMGSASILVLIALLTYVILRRNKNCTLYGKVIAVNLGATWILNEVFKVIFHRQRPDILRLVEVGGFSFPSGHSMVSLSFYGLILYFIYKNTKNSFIKYLLVIFFSLLILFIGISRIYLGVHYASDVLAGFSAGFAWLAIFITLINKYYLQEPKRHNSRRM
jgi:undecaprenyl-diphosphatase